jgi:polyferredoxin
LIRYSNQSKDQGKSSTLLRPRVFIYPVILTAIGSLLIYLLLTKQPFDTYVLRERGNQYTLAGENNTQVRNLMRLKITNRTDEPMTFSLKVLEPENGSVTASEQNLAVAGQQTETFHIDVLAPIEVFRRGRADLKLAILNQDGTEYIEPFTLLGPESRTRPATNTPATPTTPQR